MMKLRDEVALDSRQDQPRAVLVPLLWRRALDAAEVIQADALVEREEARVVHMPQRVQIGPASGNLQEVTEFAALYVHACFR